METKALYTPELRFPEFSGDWQVKTLGECFEMLQNNTLSRAELNDKSGDYQNVHYGDVLIKYGSILDLSKEQLPYINNNNVAEKYEKSLLKDGDVIIADTAEDETVGKCTEIINVGEKKIISGLHTIPIRPTIDFAKCFIGLYFNSNVWHSQLLRIMQGTKVSSISKSQLKNISVCFPTLLEQRKIAACLLSLDNLITHTRNKVDLLKQHKKGLMQKLFPKSGCNVPELRFHEFSGDWETKKFGDLIVEVSEKTNNTINTPLYSLTIEDGITTKTERYERNFLITKTDNSFKIVHQNHFVSNPMNLRFGAIGYNKNEFDVCVSAYYDVFKFKAEESVSFWINYLKSNFMLKEYDKIAIGSLVEKRRVHFSNLQKMQILVPSLTEQRKIADCLTSIDKAIEETENKVNLLEKHKKGLVQKMFVKM